MASEPETSKPHVKMIDRGCMKCGHPARDHVRAFTLDDPNGQCCVNRGVSVLRPGEGNKQCCCRRFIPPQDND